MAVQDFRSVLQPPQQLPPGRWGRGVGQQPSPAGLPAPLLPGKEHPGSELCQVHRDRGVPEQRELGLGRAGYLQALCKEVGP